MILLERNGGEQNLQVLNHNFDKYQMGDVAGKRLIIYDRNHWKDKRSHKIQLLLAILSLFALHTPQLGIFICAVFIWLVLSWSL